MNAANCLNCNQKLEPGQKYCPSCGQKSSTHRLSITSIIHGFFHSITDSDIGILVLMKGMATKPGIVAREYILGKRKKYFNPFTFFVLLMGLYVLSKSFFNETPESIKPNTQVLSQIPTEAGKQKYIAILKRAGDVSSFMDKRGNMIAMLAIPVFSLFTWVFFRKREFNFAEHLTANLLFIAFSNLFFTVFVFPLQYLFPHTTLSQLLPLLVLLLQVFYITWGLNGYLQLHSVWERLKSFAVIILATIFWSFLTMMAMAIYIYQNRHFMQFFERMYR